MGKVVTIVESIRLGDFAGVVSGFYSATGIPTSACFNYPRICTTVNFFFIGKILVPSSDAFFAKN